jgi:2-phospho-L-lactate guanylyltransferase (CobY/MobA/RfbA family)
MSPAGVANIMQSQEYKDHEAALLNGHLSAMDQALAGKVEVIHNEFKAAVPAAMRCLVDTVTQRRDLKAAMTAAKEILDRDPQRTLVSKTQDEPVAPGIPASILEAAIEVGNDVARSYNNNPKDKAN